MLTASIIVGTTLAIGVFLVAMIWCLCIVIDKIGF